MNYPFPNVNGAIVEVLEMMSNFIPNLTFDYLSMPGLNKTMLVKGAPGMGIKSIYRMMSLII